MAYRPNFPRNGWAEQDPRLWDHALGPTIARALAQAGVNPSQVTALGICGQLDGCLAVNSKGKAITPCLIWMDRRAQAEIANVPAAMVAGTGRPGAGCQPHGGQDPLVEAA